MRKRYHVLHGGLRDFNFINLLGSAPGDVSIRARRMR
jgi:hypothetical protein